MARRRDRSARLRLTYGVPLDTAGAALGLGRLPDGVGDILLTASVEAYRAWSTIESYSYDNLKTQILFLKRWDF